MTSLVFRALAARKLRGALTMLAVVLGVALISGSLILTDTFRRATEDLFQDVYGGADAVVSWKRAFETGGEESRAFPQEVLSMIRQLPEVEIAAGEIQNLIHLVGEDGSVINSGPAPTFGWGFDMTQTDFYPLELMAGAWPAEEAEAVIDLNTAETLGLSVGDTIRIVSRGPVEPYRIAGVARYRGADRSLTPVFALFTVPEAQRLFAKEGRFDSIKVAAVDGLTQDELVDRIGEILPGNLQVLTGEDQATADASDIAQVTAMLRAVLLALAGVALLVGALVIFNTLSITVAQRVREFAMLRTIGASRRQVLLAVVLETGILGLTASVVGLFSGLALAEVLRAAFGSLGVDLPPIDRTLAPLTVAASLLAGVAATLAAGLVPAVRATRVPPLAAVREGAALPRRRPRWFPTRAGLSAVALASAVIGFPGAWLGGTPGRLARANAGSQRGRTAATAAALLVGFALITLVAVLGQGLGSSIAGAVDDQVTADYVLAPAGSFTPSPPAAAQALASVPGAKVVPVRGTQAEVDGSRATVTGVDFSTIAGAYHFDWVAGSEEPLASAGPLSAIVEQSFAKENGLLPGSRIAVVSEFGEQLELQVAGLHRASKLMPMLGQVTVPLATFDAAFRDPRDLLALVSVDRGTSPQTTRLLEEALTAFPGVELRSTEDYAAYRQAQIDPLLHMIYALLAFSVVVGSLGIVNTLTLSVFERTREIGLLRAVGMTRSQVGRMIGFESLIVAFLGVWAGIGLGVLLGALVSTVLADAGLSFDLPLLSLVIFALTGGAVGILAGAFPARRAARLDVLQALRYE